MVNLIKNVRTLFNAIDKVNKWRGHGIDKIKKNMKIAVFKVRLEMNKGSDYDIDDKIPSVHVH